MSFLSYFIKIHVKPKTIKILVSDKLWRATCLWCIPFSVDALGQNLVAMQMYRSLNLAGIASTQG